MYDDAGRLTETHFPDGTIERATYDFEGRRISSTDHGGHLTSYTYDFVGRLIKTTFPDLTFTETTYDNAGQVLTTKDQRGNVTTYAYDDAGRRTSVTDALTQVTTFVYDDAGQLTSTTDARNNTTTSTYDAAGRLIKVTHPDSTFEETTYDELGRVTARKDAAGKVTQYGYDAIGRLTSVTQDPGGLNQVTQYAYDEVGSRTAQTDALNRTTAYEYDMRGRRTKRTLPLGQVETYGYNAAGNLTARTDFNGKVTTYGYDNANRLLSKTPDASFAAAPITFTYNNDGLRTAMTDPSGSSTYTPNNMHRLVSRSSPSQSALGYQYDAAGNVTKISSGAYVVDYTYDALNRLKTVANTVTGTSTYNYDPNGNLADVTAPNSMQHAYTYNSKNQLTNLNVGIGGVPPALRTYAYTLAPTGHRLSVAELSGRTASYTYDNIYRLTSETIAGDTAPTPQNGSISYAYDAVGNRQQMASTVPAIAPGLFNYDANDRFTGATADTYDANGNTISSGGIAATYDFENRLVSKGGVTVVYDGDGNRVRKVVAGITTRYLVDELNPTGYSQVLVETTTNNNFVRQYVYGLDLISQRRQLTSTPTFEVRYFGYDGHGSTRFLTDSAAAVTDTFDYDAFGNLITRTGTTPTHYLYAGEQFDADLNLYYNRARYLDVRTGRFWTMDEFEGDLQSPDSLHRYLYARGDAPNLSDPSGNFSFSLGELAGVSAIVGALSGALVGGIRGSAPGRGGALSGALHGLVYGAVFAPVVTVLIAGGGIAIASTGVLTETAAVIFTATAATELSVLVAASNYQSAQNPEDKVAAGVEIALSVIFIAYRIRGAARLQSDPFGGAGPTPIPPFQRSPLDVNVNPNPPRCLPTCRPIGKSPTQYQELQADIAKYTQLGARDIRVNQQQVNAAGIRVGINRPDFQATLGNKRIYIEYDTQPGSGAAHRQRILSNDPNGIVILK